MTSVGLHAYCESSDAGGLSGYMWSILAFHCVPHAYSVCVFLLKPGSVPSSGGLCQCGIQVSALETWRATNQRSSSGENPRVPITDLFADRQDFTLFANLITARAALF